MLEYCNGVGTEARYTQLISTDLHHFDVALLLPNDAEVGTAVSATARAPLTAKGAASSRHCHNKKPTNKEEECDVLVGNAAINNAATRQDKVIRGALVGTER